MKVFEAITEHDVLGSNEIQKEMNYVTSYEDTLKSVADYFTEHCEQYEKELMSVREVLTISAHIDTRDSTDQGK